MIFNTHITAVDAALYFTEDKQPVIVLICCLCNEIATLFDMKYNEVLCSSCVNNAMLLRKDRLAVPLVIATPNVS